MKENVLIIIGVFVFIVIIAWVFYFIFKSTGAKEVSTKSVKKAKKQSNTLEDLIKAAKEATSLNDLNKIVLIFLQTQQLEKRQNTGLSEDSKKKLSFISAVCSNPLADAKIIAFLNLELGKKYPSYKIEIDLYENLGLAKRRMR